MLIAKLANITIPLLNRCSQSRTEFWRPRAGVLPMNVSGVSVSFPSLGRFRTLFVCPKGFHFLACFWLVRLAGSPGNLSILLGLTHFAERLFSSLVFTDNALTYFVALWAAFYSATNIYATINAHPFMSILSYLFVFAVIASYPLAVSWKFFAAVNTVAGSNLYSFSMTSPATIILAVYLLPTIDTRSILLCPMTIPTKLRTILDCLTAFWTLFCSSHLYNPLNNDCHIYVDYTTMQEK